jgi:putative hydrolase of the HAD superfamily
MLRPVPLRAVVFDLFDTLVDLRFEDLPRLEHQGQRLPASLLDLHAEVVRHAEVPLDAFLEAMQAGNRAFEASHFAQDREVPTELRFRDTLERIGLAVPELEQRLTEIHMGVLESAVRALPHHAEVLEGLRGRVRIGLCSNFSHSGTAQRVLEAAGLWCRLDAVVVSDAFGLRKPRREIFDEVVSRLGVAPQETLHVGDSLRADVGGASAAGLGTAWLTRRIPDPEQALREHEGPAPDHALADLAELPALVERLAAIA